MNEQEIAVMLKALEKEVGHIKHRIEALEQATKAINDLAISVNKLAMNTENILMEMQRHDERLEDLEKKPEETSRMIKQAIITTIGGGVLGATVTKVLTLF